MADTTVFKRCTKCGEEKPYSEFYRRSSSKDGLTTWCADCMRESYRNWASKNKEKVNRYVRERRDSDSGFRERQRARDRERYKRRREQVLAYQREYYEQNAQAIKARVLEWAKEHPELQEEYRQRRKALERGAVVNDLTAADWKKIQELFGYRCAYCGTDHEPLTRDHVIPLSRGGANTALNVVPACKPCNSRKGTKIYPHQYKELVALLGGNEPL